MDGDDTMGFQPCAPRHPVTGGPVKYAWFRHWVGPLEAGVIRRKIDQSPLINHHTVQSSVSGYVHIHLYAS